MPRRAFASPACLLAEGGVDGHRTPRVAVKRISEPRSRSDGLRILVARLWPRGVPKNAGLFSVWAKELAPSTPLRAWLRQDPARWPAFVSRYRRELQPHRVEIEALRASACRRQLTLLHAWRNPRRNHALVLKRLIERL